MKLIEFIRLILKHLRLLIIAPILLAAIVMLLTSTPSFMYESKTTLYTGLATGSSIEMNKTFNYFASNIAFDNLINIIKSRETKEEVAIRLLSLHLMLPTADKKYISTKLYTEFKQKIPDYLYEYIATDSYDTISNKYTGVNESRPTNKTYSAVLFPQSINKMAYEKTVKNLTELMKSNNSNFIYELLNYDDPHYSIKALSNINAVRISNSDLIKLSYKVNDPGICQQTLMIYNEVCIKNYKRLKENRSDAVVKYFESQLKLANEKLNLAEKELFEFNQMYNIINYNEQSKAVAHVKEAMEVDYNNNIANLAGIEASSKILEEKLSIQHNIQIKSNSILENRKQLGEIKYQIALTEASSEINDDNSSIRVNLNQLAENLENEIRSSIDDLYVFQNTLSGLPVTEVLPDWMDNIVEAENLKAKIGVMKDRNKDFLSQYSIYTLAGANIKRIEREISVSEQGYLEILHGLNLAQLKLQDSELSASLKTVDTPYFPLSPIPTKRKFIIIAAAFIGVIFLLGVILCMEYYDETLRNLKRASKTIGLKPLGMLPKLLLYPKALNIKYIQNRLLEIIVQNIKQSFNNKNAKNGTKTIVIISTKEKEGKSVMAANIASLLKKEGSKVLVLNYTDFHQQNFKAPKFNIINKLLGYQEPALDSNNPFLSNLPVNITEKEYFKYEINNQFYKTKTYTDILELNKIKIDSPPNYVLIELPSLLNNNYPYNLISNCDLSVLVCRSNRIWTEADKLVLNNLLPYLKSRLKFILNGVEIKEVESVLGELPNIRSGFRKKIKKIIKFQFFTKNQI